MLFAARLRGDRDPPRLGFEDTAASLAGQCLVISLAAPFHPQLLRGPGKLQLPLAPRFDERVFHVVGPDVPRLVVDVVRAEVGDIGLEHLARNACRAAALHVQSGWRILSMAISI